MKSATHSVRYILLSAILCLSGFTAMAKESDEINHCLDRIDSKFFMDGIIKPQSGQNGVEFAALRRSEAQFLIEHSEEAIPLMLERFAAMTRTLKVPDAQQSSQRSESNRQYYGTR